MKKKGLLLMAVGTVAITAALFCPIANAQQEEKQSLPPSQVRMDSEDESASAVADKPQEKNPLPAKASQEITLPVPPAQAQPAAHPVEIPALDTAAAPTPGSVSQTNEEKVFREMDKLNLEIARIQMEMKLASLQIQKLQLELQKDKLQEELAQHRPEQGGSYAAVLPSVPVVGGTPDVLSIMSYAGQKSAILRISGHTQEVKEGEKVDTLGTIVRIEPESDSVVVSKGGVEHRVYVLGSEKNNG